MYHKLTSTCALVRQYCPILATATGQPSKPLHRVEHCPCINIIMKLYCSRHSHYDNIPYSNDHKYKLTDFHLDHTNMEIHFDRCNV